MLSFAAPLFLAAGALVALVPLALHFVARRPPERRPLPTARFLDRAERAHVRMRRRPSEPLLLLLRLALVAAVAAAFARPSWEPARSGTSAVVLLDRGAAMSGAWAAAVDAARSELAARGEAGAFPAGAQLVLFGAQSERVALTAPSESFFDSLRAAPPTADAPAASYAAALGALPAAARAARAADSLEVVLITRPRWRAWSPGLAEARAALFPARIRLVDPGAATAPDDLNASDAGAAGAAGAEAASAGDAVAEAAPRRAHIILPATTPAPPAGGAPPGAYLTAALEALGWEVAASGAEPAAADIASLIVDLDGAPLGPSLRGRVEEGAVLLSAGELPPGSPDWLAWVGGGPAGPGAGLAGRDGEPADPGAAASGPLLFRGARGQPVTLHGAARGAAGAPADDARVLAVWQDGRAAAAARGVGEGCSVHLATALEGGALPLSSAYPALLAALLAGCEGEGEGEGMGEGEGVGEGARDRVRDRARGVAGDWSGAGDLPLDSGAMAVLVGPERPGAVALAALPGVSDRGRPLTRWLLAAALALALLEGGVLVLRGRRG